MRYLYEDLLSFLSAFEPSWLAGRVAIFQRLAKAYYLDLAGFN